MKIKTPSLKEIFATVMVWFTMMWIFDKTYRETRRECPELDRFHKTMWGIIYYLGLILFFFIAIIIFILGW